jgi:hypothetical protein
MSVVPQERIPQLDFSPQVVEQALDEVKSPPTLGDLRATELPYIEGSGIYDLWINMVREAAPLDARDILAPYKGFILGTAMVRLAAGGDLPVRSPVVVNHYAAQIERRPDRLEADFTRDYYRHLPVLDLFERILTLDRLKQNAKMVLNVFGDLANPERPPFEFPQPRLKQPRRSSGQSFAVRGATHRR